MPNIKSAAKRAAQSQEQRLRNRATRSVIASERRTFFEAVEAKDKDKAMKEFKAFCALLDKSSKRGIIKKNNADRRKARAAHQLAKLA